VEDACVDFSFFIRRSGPVRLAGGGGTAWVPQQDSAAMYGNENPANYLRKFTSAHTSFKTLPFESAAASLAHRATMPTTKVDSVGSSPHNFISHSLKV
jgi:hypothetical protein